MSLGLTIPTIRVPVILLPVLLGIVFSVPVAQEWLDRHPDYGRTSGILSTYVEYSLLFGFLGLLIG